MGLTQKEKQIRKEQRFQEKWNETHKTIDGIDHKLCGICQIYFPATLEYFYKKNCFDNLDTYCKSCAKSRAEEWRFANPLKFKKNYMKRNHVPKAVERRIAFSKYQRESGYSLNWQRKNRDKIKLYNNKHRNHDISMKEWDACRLYFNYRCAYCGMTYEDHYKIHRQDLHKEHVLHDGRNDIKNCVPACRVCNTSKHTKTLNEWYNAKNPNYTYERYYKIYIWLRYDCLKYIRQKKN